MIKNINRHILPECFIDTNLIETLVPPAEIGRLRIYNHKKGCNAVVKEMQEEFKDNFAVGVMDIDKRDLKYLAEFDKFEQQNIKLCSHKNLNKKHFIILHPPIEQWIIDQAKQVNISLSDYELPVTLHEIKTITKRESSKNDHRFKRLFKALRENNAQGITQLFRWIDYLIKTNYKADTEELRIL